MHSALDKKTPDKEFFYTTGNLVKRFIYNILF